jgi:hypothetical protein
MESPHKGKTGLRRLINATDYSLSGFAAAARHEDAFRQELICHRVAPFGPGWHYRVGVPCRVQCRWR